MVKTDTNPIVFILVSRDFCLDSVSPENLLILSEGLGWDIQPGTFLPDLLDESHRNYFVEQLRRGFSGDCFSFEILFPCQKTKTKACEVWVTPSHREAGEVSKIGLAIKCNDEFAEDLARLSSNGLLSVVFNTVSMGICITDRQGKFVEVNQEYCRIYGYKREELIGKSFTIVVEQKYHEYLEKIHQDFFINGTEPPGELEVITKDGRILTIEVFADLLTTPDGEVFKVTTINDLTELKKLELQVDTMAKNLPGIVLRYILKPDGTDQLLYVSEGMSKLCGISSKEAMNNSNLVWDRIQPDFISGIKNSILQSASTLQTWESEWKYLHPEGTVHWHRAKGNPKRLLDGSTVWDTILMDITDEKVATEALAETEKRFEKLISEGVEMIAVLSANGEYAYNSPAYQSTLGYTVEELRGVQAFSLIHPDDIAQLFSEFEQVFLTKKVYSQPYRIRKKDGAYVWLKSVGTNLLDDPMIQGIVVNSSDITELVQKETDLLSSEKQYKYLFENNPGSMMIWDLETGKILDVNEKACELYGYSYPEFLEVNVFEMRPKEEIPGFQKMASDESWVQDVGAKLYHGISRHLTKSGEILHIEVNAQMIDYRGKRVSLVLLHDVTEKLKAQQEVILSEEKYRSVFNLSPLPKLIYRRDTLEILDINEAAIQNYGYSREEFLKLTPLDIRPETNKEVFLKFHQEDVPFGKTIKFGVNTHQKKNGNIMYIDISGQRFLYQGLDCMMIVAIDVTEKMISDKLDDLELGLMEEVIQADLSLEAQLEKFLTGIEGIIPGIKTSIHRLKEDRLYNLASPGISNEFLEQLEGLQIGMESGTCGACAFFKKRILTEDISNDPIWFNFSKIAGKEGFRSSLSLPVFDSEKQVIATVGIYFLDQITNDSLDIERFQRASSLISLILENNAKKEELKLSNERYEYVNLATRDALYDWDIENNKLYWGKSYERFLGSESLSGDVQLENWKDLVHPEDTDRVIQILDQDLSNPEKERFVAEYQIRKNDGSYVYVIDRGVIVRNDSGKAVRLVGVISDVTQQRLEELRLKLLESVITHANDAVLITEAEPAFSPGPRIVYVNEAFTRMTGFTAEEVLGKSPRILQGPKTNPKDLEVLREALNTWQSCEVTTVNYKKNGEEFWTNFSISPVADASGWFTHWISIQRDVTAQKMEEQKKELLAQVVRIFGEEERFNFALDRGLEQLVRFRGFDAGEIWLVNSDKTKLNLVSRYAMTDEGARFFSGSDKKVGFKKGEGLVGKIWEREEVLTYEELSGQGHYERQQVFFDSGMKDAFGVPLYFNSEVIGVVLFATHVKKGLVQFDLELFSALSPVLGAEIHRKKVEDELSQIFDTAQDIICITGFDGRFKKVNRGFTYLTGYSEEELLALRYDHFVHPEDRDETETELKNLAQGRNLLHFENRLLTKDGEVIWLEWNSTVVVEEELIYSVAQNITEAKQLENLLESANKMARIGFWDVDIASGQGKQYWSPVTKEIFEVEPDFTPDVSQGIRFYTEEAVPLISECFAKCATTGEPYDLELPILSGKGNKVWVRTIGQAEFRDGQCIRVYGTIQDITDLKIAQLELERSFEQKNAILESIGDAFFSVDKQGIITYWNQEAYKLFGGAKEEMVGRGISDLFPLITEVSILEKLRKANFSGEVVRFEQFFVVLDKWLEISIYPSEIGLSVYLKDITIRKTTEELIRQSNERFENATKATRDAIWDHDLRTDHFYWGEGFRTLFGYELNSGGQYFNSWTLKIHPEDKIKVVENVVKALADESVVNIQNEYRFLKADSTYAYVTDRGMIIRDSQGKAIRVVGAISDVTERKEFESSLRSLNEKLEARARELATSNAELEQFAYVASHDLQEPLRMVTSFLSQLEIKYQDQLDERAKKYIHFAVDGAKRMRQIILDLLEFSRVGRENEEPVEIALDEIIQEVCALQYNLIQSKNAKISFSDLPVIKGARTPMIQVFQNLISNAVKYSKENVNIEVKISCRELPDFWEFSVEDNGIGMDADSFSKIFVIFQRLHTTDKFAGTGIGLAIVKKIVENLGGRIWVDSTPDVGTTFRFTLRKEL